MMNKAIRAGALLLLLGTGAAWAGEEVMVDGVLHIQNGAEPENGVRNVMLEEMWRVGGEDSEDFFGLITQAVLQDDGTLYLLDTRLAEVPVYSADGERIDTLSREGDGPGEVRIPSNIIFMPDGSLGILQIFPGKIVKVGLDNTPMGNIEFGDKTAGGFLTLLDCATQGDRLVVSGEKIKQNPPTGQIRTSFAGAYTMAGEELMVYESHERTLDFTKFHWAEDEIRQIDFRKLAVAADGRVYVVSRRDGYSVQVYLPDGTPDRVITREYERRPRTDDEVTDVETTLQAQLAQLPDATWDISKFHPDIGMVKIGPDGNLWVQCSRGAVDLPEGVFFMWDVFTPDGHFIEQVAAHCPGDGDEDMLLWSSEAAVMVTGFLDAAQSMQRGGAGGGDEEDEEAAPMEVIYFKITDG